MGVDAEDIRRVQRLGRRSEATAAPRPMLVQLSSRLVKNLIMESLYKIKSMDAKFEVWWHMAKNKGRNVNYYSGGGKNKNR